MHEIQLALTDGWNPEMPVVEVEEEEIITLLDSLDEVINEKLSSKLSDIYKRSLS